MKNSQIDRLDQPSNLGSYLNELCDTLTLNTHTMERRRRTKHDKEEQCCKDVICLIDNLQIALENTDLPSLLTIHNNEVQTQGKDDDILTENPSDIVLNKLIQALYICTEVGMFNRTEDYDYKLSDFQGVPQRATTTMKCYVILLQKLNMMSEAPDGEMRRLTRCVMRNLLTKAVLLSGEHVNVDSLWTDGESCTTAETLLGQILESTDCDTLQHLLCSPTEGSMVYRGLLMDVFSVMKENLGKDIWKKRPSSGNTFKWLLLQIKSPNLSDHLSSVLPPSLNFIDDHQEEHKVLGVACLDHIIREVSAPELVRHGRAEVILQALQHQLYSRDPQLLNATLPALITVLAVVETPPRKVAPPRSETRYDRTLEQVLHDMELENGLVLRRVYSHHLPPLLTAMGITLLRNMPCLMRVVYNYLEIYDGPTEESRLNALVMLRTVITEVWPRMAAHAASILRCLLRLVYDVTTDRTLTPCEVNQELVRRCTECGVVLRRAAPDTVDHLLTSLHEIDVSAACRKFVSDIEATS